MTSWFDSVPVPTDANGCVVPLDTKELVYRGKTLKVYGFFYSVRSNGWCVEFGDYEYIRLGVCTLPDSWERLERDALQLSDWSSQQVARSKWLHIVTARHLRKARRTIRELRGRVERLQDRCYEKDLLLDGYRGQIGRDNPFASVPEHYQGDGFVTCDRAIESASSQECIAERSPLQFWYWATAMKYVWRLWSKEDPEKDALKAIDCLEKAAGVGRLVRDEERDNG